MKPFSFSRQITILLVVVLGVIFLSAIYSSANENSAASGTKNQMKRAKIDGLELEYEVRGAGDPVLFIHAGVLADWFEPLMAEDVLSKRYRLISYHRVGYANSSRVTGSVSTAQQASHVVSLLNHLGIKRAHIVGHSSGGNIALQVALDAPEVVQTLVLLEPALKVMKGAEDRARAFAPVHERYRQGDKAGAIDAFMRAVTGPDYRSDLDRLLPGAFEQAVANTDTFIGQELPALQEWVFSAEEASRITQPVLSVIGEKNLDILVWKERHEMILNWLPNAKPFVLSDTTHLLHVQNPRGMADGLLAFFESHPLSPAP